MFTADYFIDQLNLKAHIEGGYYSETYRNPVTYTNSNGERALSTLIYFLLKGEQASKFHSLTSDEIWLYHYGSPIIIHTFDEKGNYKTLKLGLDSKNGEQPQVLIKSHLIFGAELLLKKSFSLVSCLVSPGFDFSDFKLYSKNELLLKLPEHKELITKFIK